MSYPDNYLGIWGIERSGTNYLELLCKQNLDAWVSSHKKHEARFAFEKTQKVYEHYGDTGKFVAIIKNPYAWAYSNHIKYGVEVRPRFNKLRRPIRDFQRRITAYYNHNNMSYIEMSQSFPDRVLILTYDDIIEKGADWGVNLVSDKLKIPKKGSINDIIKTVGPVCRVKKNDFNKSFYLDKKYLEKLSESQIDFISNNVDKRIMEFCKFEYEES